jgi:hypothetical protein
MHLTNGAISDVQKAELLRDCIEYGRLHSRKKLTEIRKHIARRHELKWKLVEKHTPSLKINLKEHRK